MIDRRRTRRGLAVALIATSAIAFTGCFPTGDPNGSSDDPDRQDDTAPTVILTEDTLVGTWGSTDEDEPNLTFDTDGTVSGTDGCNEISGDWSLDDGIVTVAPMLITQIGCEAVDTWMAGLRSVVLTDNEDDELTVRDDTDAPIGTLDRND